MSIWFLPGIWHVAVVSQWPACDGEAVTDDADVLFAPSHQWLLVVGMRLALPPCLVGLAAPSPAVVGVA